jgi:type IV secretion system protein VirB1
MDSPDLQALVQQCAPTVHPTTMMRVIGVESMRRENAIGYKITKEGKTYTLTKQPRNKNEAISWASWLYANGYVFDAGIAQVNSTQFARFHATPANIFDACTNIYIGSRILTEFYGNAVKKYGEGNSALFAALSAYNSGNFYTGFSNGYVQKILTGSPPSASMPPIVAGYAK